MKLETQIAKENIENFNSVENKIIKIRILSTMNSHKQSCERFLEFLENSVMQSNLRLRDFNFIDGKITDLKKAIKLYEENRL